MASSCCVKSTAFTPQLYVNAFLVNRIAKKDNLTFKFFTMCLYVNADDDFPFLISDMERQHALMFKIEFPLIEYHCAGISNPTTFRCIVVNIARPINAKCYAICFALKQHCVGSLSTRRHHSLSAPLKIICRTQRERHRHRDDD